MDNFIENLKKGMKTAKSEAGRLTKTLAGKTGSIVDSTKIAIAKNGTESKINELYAKIGKIVYDKHSHGKEIGGEIGELCIHLDKFVSELNDLNEQLAELKNTVTCPSCGSDNCKESTFCSDCGARLSSNSDTATVDIVSEDD